MTIYLDAYRDFCNPLSFCDKIIPGTFGWRALKFVHRVWWFQTRKQKIIQDGDKIGLALRGFFAQVISYSSVAKSAAQFLMIIVKIEEMFTAFDESQKHWRCIKGTWRGDFHVGHPPGIHIRVAKTSKAIFHYLTATFCLTMMFIDVIDAIMFTKKTQCEAALLVKSNLAKVIQYCTQSESDLRNKLYTNRKLVDMILQKTNKNKSSNDFIDDITTGLREYKKVSNVIADTSSLAWSVLEKITKVTYYILKTLVQPSTSDKFGGKSRFYQFIQDKNRKRLI